MTTLDGGGAETFGRRYVFAFIDRSTISSEVRLNYTFKPDLSLEFYGEPFAASGRYYSFGELAAPGRPGAAHLWNPRHRGGGSA